MKSFLKRGNATSRLIIARFSRLPKKYFSSVKTDIAAAPFSSYVRAVKRGSKSLLMTPFDGEPFFTSQMTFTLSFVMADEKGLGGLAILIPSIRVSSVTRVRLADTSVSLCLSISSSMPGFFIVRKASAIGFGDKGFEFFHGLARINRAVRYGDALFEAPRLSRDRYPRGGVKQNYVSRGAFLAAQDVRYYAGVFFRISAHYVNGSAPLQAEVLGLYAVCPYKAILEFRDLGLSGEGYLVESVQAVHYESMHASQV